MTRRDFAKASVIKYLFTLLVLFLSCSTHAQNTFLNPIFPGGYPDPSICRVGDDFYIVNSSFEYYPGLPIHHSTDLVNWDLIGYGLHREDQCDGEMNLVDVQQRGGIHAPSIRFHDGIFYIITTNVYAPANGGPAKMINFIITAKDPVGPWSEPHIIEGAPGIDPDLFFDDDGRVYFVGTHAVGDSSANGIGEIWVQELDLNNWSLIGPRHTIWDGACGGCCVEGPHIYKEHGMYYLMIAEGGTGMNHAVMIAASEFLTGPYDSNPRNPILTSRHLSRDHWVNSTGHADLVQLADGRWYMVALGIRGEVQRRTNMGRETHLIPVVWEPAIVRWQQVSENRWEPVEYLWPVVAPETGRVLRRTPLPFPERPQFYNDAFYDSFDDSVLNHEWNFRRVPATKTYSLSEHPGHLRLYLKPEIIKLRGRYSLMGFRQKETNFEYRASMTFTPSQDHEEAGVSIFQQDDNYIMFTIMGQTNQSVIKLMAQKRDEDPKVYSEKTLPNYQGSVIFKVNTTADSYTFSYSTDQGESFEILTEHPNDWVLSHGYTGAYLGIYATSSGEPTSGYADFDWVSYKGFLKN